MRRLERGRIVPDTLERLKAAGDAALERQHRLGEKLLFRQHVYAADDVREALSRFHHGKCAYCEAGLAPVTAGHVEHFRPKAAVVKEHSGQKVQPGYFWLAYEWSNLLLGCPECNSQGNKGNRFPLEDEKKRSSPANRDCSLEAPLLVDPCQDFPRRHIRFREEVAYPAQGSARGHMTIQIFGLNSAKLREARRRHIEIVSALRTLRNLNDGNLSSEAESLLNEFESEKGYFASCIKDRFKLRFIC